MGWETHGVCVESESRQLGEVYYSVTCKKKTTLLDYYKRWPALLHPPTLSTPSPPMWFFYVPPTHVCWHSKTQTDQPNTFGLLYFNVSVSFLLTSAGTEVPLSREEEVDLALLKNDSGVESALLYAKAWSKYIKDLLGWMEKRLAMGMPI